MHFIFVMFAIYKGIVESNPILSWGVSVSLLLYLFIHPLNVCIYQKNLLLLGKKLLWFELESYKTSSDALLCGQIL